MVNGFAVKGIKELQLVASPTQGVQYYIRDIFVSDGREYDKDSINVNINIGEEGEEEKKEYELQEEKDRETEEKVEDYIVNNRNYDEIHSMSVDTSSTSENSL